MSGRRFQFSVWNLMLAMVPLAVVFGLASQVNAAGRMVWVVAALIAAGPAVGALIGGWKGMAGGILLAIGIGLLAWLAIVFEMVCGGRL
jgi:hypothetical protein